MNPVFVILVVLAAIALWFILSFAFNWIGKLFFGIWENAIDNLNKKENESEEPKG